MKPRPAAWLALRALRRGAGQPERAIALLYWAPLAFWAVMPRMQLYYYFLPSSLWLGPAVVWALLTAIPRPRAARVAVIGLTAACAALFLWFLPILDGRLHAGSYERYMWARMLERRASNSAYWPFAAQPWSTSARPIAASWTARASRGTSWRLSSYQPVTDCFSAAPSPCTIASVVETWSQQPVGLSRMK